MRYADDMSQGAASGPVPPTRKGGERTSSRRSFIRSTSAGVTSVALGVGVAAATGPAADAAESRRPATARRAAVPLAVTPACSGHETPESVEGPLFKPSSPARGDLITPGVRGVRLDLSGVVYDTACKPLPETLIEFWQCDENGDYDTSGFSLRGHQYTDSRGAYLLRTIIPRDYWGRWGQRAPHIHTQVQASGGPVLVTQLYFPDDTQAYGRDFAALNAADRLLNRACTINLTGPADGRYTGTFNFVITTKV
ncbi:Protocatechuate 3,4-dioxygenase beta subunit [Streptomyces sp. 2224.1]|nr:protocatechuate 3,4-dioxygenase beta subunit [Streptomyces sp. 2321.6]SDR58546.1 Protocatechuate 3,4-dioxygenase beta subunit [Streptomyces sp. KS_16]SEB75326.1 Protocatechuate 3,4-dioxygenase beta subunit [Streptomyces sp. 2133.1]SED49030.1 Protocatechuate 3,4-dioxygenase beta subunit [Streptomyces sp. 2224.1]SNC60509.1 Protocatechuate 3,4-dioxygenase beta subunit [Streptomyces sp. 2114.4]